MTRNLLAVCIAVGVIGFGAAALHFMPLRKEALKAQSNTAPTQVQDSWVLAKVTTRNGHGLLRYLENPSKKKSDYPWLIMVTMPVVGEMPTTKEMDTFTELENRMANVEASNGLFLSACVTLDHRRDWLLYARSPKEAIPLAKEINRYHPKIEYREQPDWEEYEALISIPKANH